MSFAIPKGTAVQAKAMTFYELTKEALKVPLSVLLESIRLFPDSLVVGTAILTAISFNKAYGLLLASMLELMMVQRLFASVVGGISPVEPGKGAYGWICQPGFVFPNTMRISILEQIGKPSAFPSPIMFFLTGVVTYMVASLQEFEKELTTLGADTAARTKFAIILSALLLLAVFIMRLSYGCETFGATFMSMIVGMLIGYASFAGHKMVFGREGVNVLSLPLIRTMDERGKPLYVCAPS